MAYSMKQKNISFAVTYSNVIFPGGFLPFAVLKLFPYFCMAGKRWSMLHRFAIYQKHEDTFDHCSIHGRMHICRALIFGEAMCRYYQKETSIAPSVIDVRYAIAFHDSGMGHFDFWVRAMKYKLRGACTSGKN